MAWKNGWLGMFVFAWAAASVWAAGPMYIQVKETQVREKPSFTGRILATLNYGAQVTVSEESGAWSKVSLGAPRTQGWIHSSALTSKKLALSAGQAGTSAASSGEVALAGKGFNAQVEAQYKANTGLDFSWIDRMEKMVVSPEEALRFMADGGLAPKE
jgi:uncharacterized protein YgiM (DUF1202 family)